jgi:ABC-type bacteriocin/lantibiotic exporter with double-glycine peptidase domain
MCLACLGLLPSLVEAEAAAVWLDVPFVKQEANGCGAAAIAMVMRYWSREDADPHRIYKALYSQEVQGIRGEDVERFLRVTGFQTFVFHGDWQDLEQHLAKGRPLMVCLREGRTGPLHYVVVSGLDTRHNVVLVNDPARRKLLKVERGVFETDWTGSDRWTLLAVPQQSR